MFGHMQQSMEDGRKSAIALHVTSIITIKPKFQLRIPMASEPVAKTGGRRRGMWVGMVLYTRTPIDLLASKLRMIVNGDQMTEYFRRPDGTKIRLVWERMK
jgi:hypothetical protein